MKYAFFLDIDHTLLDRTVPEVNKEAIAEAQKLGHKVFINTGRSYGHIPFDKLEGISFDGVVAGLGASILYEGQWIRKRVAEPALIRRISKFFADRNTQVIWEGMHGLTAYGSQEGFTNDWVRYKTDAEFDAAIVAAEVNKISVMRPITEEEVQFMSPLLCYVHDHYSESHFPDCNKAEAMLALAEIAGFTREQCIAMGDSSNDLEMLLAAGHNVVMGNGLPSVVAQAEYVSCSAGDGGVADGIAHFVPELGRFAFKSGK